MSRRHRAVVKARTFGSGDWWVELARAGAALFCVLAYGALLCAVYAVLNR